MSFFGNLLSSIGLAGPAEGPSAPAAPAGAPLPELDPEEVRRKRLAKLGGNAAPGSPRTGAPVAPVPHSVSSTSRLAAVGSEASVTPPISAVRTVGISGKAAAPSLPHSTTNRSEARGARAVTVPESDMSASTRREVVDPSSMVTDDSVIALSEADHALDMSGDAGHLWQHSGVKRVRGTLGSPEGAHVSMSPIPSFPPVAPTLAAIPQASPGTLAGMGRPSVGTSMDVKVARCLCLPWPREGAITVDDIAEALDTRLESASSAHAGYTGMHASTAANLQGVDYLVWVYNRAADVFGLQGGAKGRQQGPEHTPGDAVGTSIQLASLQCLALLLAIEDMHELVPRAFTGGVSGAGQVAGACLGVGAGDGPRPADSGEPVGARVLWHLLVSAAAELSGGRRAGLLTVSSDFLTDLCIQVEEAAGEGTVQEWMSHVAWRLLSAAQKVTPLYSADRARVSSLLMLLVSVRPCARALVNTQAFTGEYSLAQATAAGAVAPAPRISLPGRRPGPASGQEALMQQAMLMHRARAQAAGPGGAASTGHDGAHLEQGTILGCILSPSSMPSRLPPIPGMGSTPVILLPSPAVEGFEGIGARTITQAGVASAVQTVRAQTGAAVDVVHACMLSLLKADGQAREGVLAWIRSVLAHNGERAKDMFDGGKMASDGFFLNLCAVLCRLTEPIGPGSSPLMVDPSPSMAVEGTGAVRIPRVDKTDKLAHVDVSFLESDSPASGLAEDRLVAVSSTDPSSMLPAPPTSAPPTRPTPKQDSTFSFSTRIFFYTLRALRLGLARVFLDMDKEDRMLGQFSREATSAPAGAAATQAQERFAFALSNKYALDACRLDPALLSPAVKVCALALELVGRACAGAIPMPGVGGSGGSTEATLQVRVPFALPATQASRALPESLMTTPLGILSAIADARDPSTGEPLAGHIPPLIGDATVLPTVLHTITAFLASDDAFLRSPHTRASMGDALYGLFLPHDLRPGQGRQGRGQTADAFEQTAAGHLSRPSHFASSSLAPALMALYGTIEATGHYDKVGHRMKVAAMLSFMWSLHAYKPSFRTIATTGNGRRFVSFANGIIGQTTDALTEALKGLPALRDGMRAQSAGEWASLPEEDRAARIKALEETEQAVRNGLTLANQTTPLLAILTGDATVGAAFMRPELAGRLATMLVKVVEDLGGPRGLELKIDNPASYNFEPRRLLTETLTSLLQLSVQDGWVGAVAGSGVWSGAVMERVAVVAERIGLLPLTAPPASSAAGVGPVSLPALRSFIRAVNEALTCADEEEEELGEPPEELCDPMLLCLMRDAVRTPEGRVYDRSSIVQHLLQKQSDPYTRTPLTLDQLVPADDVKEQVEAFIRERKREAARARDAKGGAPPDLRPI